MSLISKLRETLVCLKAGRVTLPYPAQAQPVPEKFRGRPIFDAAKDTQCPMGRLQLVGDIQRGLELLPDPPTLLPLLPDEE